MKNFDVFIITQLSLFPYFFRKLQFFKETTHREMSLARSLSERFKYYVGKHKIAGHTLIDEFHPQFCRISDIGTRVS